MSVVPPAGDPPVTPPATPTTPPVATPPATPPVVDPDWLNPRLDRAKSAAATETRAALAKKLGVPVDKLDERLDTLAQLEKDHETDLQRQAREATERATADTEARVRGEFATKLTTAQERLITAAITTAAQAAGFRRPDDVCVFLKGDATITIDDEFVVKGVDKAIDKMKADRPDWLGGETVPFRGAPPANNSRGGTPQADMDALRAEQRAQRTGGRRTRL